MMHSRILGSTTKTSRISRRSRMRRRMKRGMRSTMTIKRVSIAKSDEKPHAYTTPTDEDEVEEDEEEVVDEWE